MLRLHAFSLGFWLILVNSDSVIYGDLLQKIVTFFTIMSREAGTNALMLVHQVLRYPPSTHFMEVMVIMHHRISRPNADIQLLCDFVNRQSSILKNLFPSSFFILCGYGCG
jgi:hypothetical protein